MGLLARTYNDNTITLIFSGNLDADGSQSALPQLDKVIANPEFNEIEVELTNVTFLDSSGVGAIVYLYKRLIAKERSMRIENVSGQRRYWMIMPLPKTCPPVPGNGF
ncbi:STAS domain-containing protein [Vibrio salinus]|uniref:STAS domain-containing protein n=1 Tax=Vibrio salinus TaxID=2899784 RepID=UPI001E56539E|nr:STAS domain-containing protein [Vibrio salinus]MCE0493728.1 STAS domain-containing protein [Vibrio salinus]